MPILYSLQDIRFEWDAKKAVANRSKHGVDSEQACVAFFDPFLRAIGAGFEGGDSREAVSRLRDWQLLYVVYVERADAFRNISARSATRPERKTYEDQ